MMRGRGAEGGRGQGGERLSTLFFLVAVLPAGPCSLTCWLEEGGRKKMEERERREKRLKLHVRLQG